MPPGGSGPPPGGSRGPDVAAVEWPVARLIGRCPTVQVSMGGVDVPCILDTGSMVTTVTRSFFEAKLRDQLGPTQACPWLRLKAANGLAIPYVGYVEVDMVVGGHSLPGVGVLITDPPGSEDPVTPGLLGMNVIQHCFQECWPRSGPTEVAFQWEPAWHRAFSACRRVQQLPEDGRLGQLRTLGTALSVAPGTIAWVPARCPHLSDASWPAVLLESGGDVAPLAPGLLVSSALLPVRDGVVWVPVANVGCHTALVTPKAILGEAFVPAAVQPTHSDYEVRLEGVEAEVRAVEVVSDSSAEVDFSEVDWSNLTAEQARQGQRLLAQYVDVFSQSEQDLGCTDLVQHEIPLTDTHPVRQRYRRLPPSQYEQVRQHIQELLANGVIRPSASPYASPIVLVQKKSGELRMCVDYRQLNARTLKDAYPLPRIEESLDALGGARFFSTLDLASGYNQVPVAESDRPKTAFCTPFGLYEFNRMPFGLCNAPGTFQRLMERVFGDQSLQSLLLYLDDIVVFSASFEQHLGRLQMVLERLRQHNLKLKLSKCRFFAQEVRYLGHVISASGVATDPEKTRAVADWPRPNTAREVRSFLGFASYYRRFVPDFARHAAPLHRLAAAATSGKRGVPPVAEMASGWSEECEAGFQALKASLVTAPVLAYADFSLPFVLDIDASYAGLGAVLSQEQGGRRRPIAYASRGLRPTERNMSNYSSRKLELLGLKWAVTEKFKEYLLGHRCIVYTDNNPLSYLQTAKLGATEHRWAAELALFDLEIRYRPGTANRNADALSRLPGSEVDSGPPLRTDGPAAARQVTALPTRTATELQQLQAGDPDIGEFLRWWRQGAPPTAAERSGQSWGVRRLVGQWERMTMQDGVLYRVVRPPGSAGVVRQLVLPSVLKGEVLRELHDRHGHQGRERTARLVAERCYWPGAHRDITAYCRDCERCILAKAVVPQVRVSPGHLEASRPLELVAIDFTLMERARDGREHLLVVTDVFSKFTQAFPTRDQKASTVAKVLTERWFYVYGVPERLHSDQGRNFESDLLRQLCSTYGIVKSRTTPYHPQGNGQCERFNRTLHDLLRTLPPEQKAHWPRHLPQVLFAYNTTVHGVTHTTPYELMFGRPAWLPVDHLLGREAGEATAEWVVEHQQRMRDVYERARAHLAAARARAENNAAVPSTTAWAPGTLVLQRSHPVGRNKIQDAWGPTVYKVLSPLDGQHRVYTIQPVDGSAPPKQVHRTELRVAPPQMRRPEVNPAVRVGVPGGGHQSESEDEDLDFGWIGEVVSRPWVHRPVPGSRMPSPQRAALVPVAPPRISGSPGGPCLSPTSGAPSPLREEAPPPSRVRPVRTTAGHHSNPHRLPRSAVAESPAVTSPLRGGSQSGGGCDGATRHGSEPGAGLLAREPEPEPVPGAQEAGPSVPEPEVFSAAVMAARESSCSADERLHARIGALVRAANERVLPCSGGVGWRLSAGPHRNECGLVR